MIETILKSIPLFSALPRTAIKLRPLSGLSNINYHVKTSIGDYVLRIPRSNTNTLINRDNEAFNTDLMKPFIIAPEFIWRQKFDGVYTGVTLNHYLADAVPLTNTSINQHTSNNLAEILAKIHSGNMVFKGILDIQKISELLTYYLSYCTIDNQDILQDDVHNALHTLKNINDDLPLVPSHGDLVLENILSQADKLWLIDWEYSTMASPYWDIAIFCNSAGLNNYESSLFLQSVQQKYFANHVTNNDLEDACETLKHYQVITKTLSVCWVSAFAS